MSRRVAVGAVAWVLVCWLLPAVAAATEPPVTVTVPDTLHGAAADYVFTFERGCAPGAGDAVSCDVEYSVWLEQGP